MGQLGVPRFSTQLATEPPPAADTTKDRQYWSPSLSVAGASTPPNWDRYQLWGMLGSYQQAAPTPLPANKILAIPMWINRAGTIDKVVLDLATAFGAPSKFVVGLYGNNLDGEVYPGLKLAQSSETTLDSGGSSAIVTWTAGYQVAAGTLLWLVVSVGQASLSFLTGANCSFFPGMMGTRAVGGTFSGSADDFDPISGFRETLTYSATLPATFPLAGAIDLFGTASGGGLNILPTFAFRFAKS